jgi:hypothetical protein
MMQDNSNSNQNSEQTTIETENETSVVTETATEVTEGSESDENPSAEASASEEAPQKEQVKIEFPYSEILREKAPKAFEVAEKVATDWKNEGDFTDLGITHPVAGIVASQALTKAKEVEKKLEEKGVFTMAKMGLEIAKSQVETIKSKIVK